MLRHPELVEESLMFRQRDRSEESGRQHPEFHLVVTETQDYDVGHERSAIRNGFLMDDRNSRVRRDAARRTLGGKRQSGVFFYAIMASTSCWAIV